MGFSLGGLVGGAIGSLFGPTGTAVGYGIGDAANSAYESNRQDSLNKQAFNRQNSAQWAFWHANNDYNSPKSQMQRLEEAGLNPNLVYGNGAATHQATMATAGKSGAAGFKLNTAPLIEFYQLENMEAQNQNLYAQNKNLQHQEQVISEQARAERLRNDFFEQHGYYPPTGMTPYASAFGINPDVSKAWSKTKNFNVAKPIDSRYPAIGRNKRRGTGSDVVWWPW